MSKREAQQRIQRIFAFREELSTLEDDDVISVSNADRVAIGAYHDELIADFAQRYDTDLSKFESQLSWGMRIASTLGAIALSLGVFMFFDYYWDYFPTFAQVGLLTAAPFLGWGASEWVAKTYKTPHYTLLAVLVSVACFVADLYIVGRVYNITPSPNALLAWGAFGLLLAYRHDLMIVLGVSLMGLTTFLGGFLTLRMGYAWPNEHLPELYLLGPMLCIAGGMTLRWDAVVRYRHVYIFIGLLKGFMVLEWLLCCPRESVLPFSENGIDWFYTLVAFGAAGVAVWRCIRAQWPAGTYLSAVFLVVFMLHRYADWFWEELPHYLFFLILGGISIVIIALLRRMRSLLREAGA